MSFQVCNRCVMDASAPSITFDEAGICNFCSSYLELLDTMPSTETRSQQLKALVNRMKSEGQGKAYDCIIGVSGGVDSTYVAYLVKQLGLRPLAVHLDNGWNSELAVSNIEKILTKLNIDLYTHVIDWNEFRDLQMSFLKASTPGMEIPSDHAIYAVLNRMAARYKVRYIINGSNFKMEYIMEPAWSEMVGQMDWKLIKNVHKQFGQVKLKTYPHFSRKDLYLSRFVNRSSVINILDYVDFSKNEAMKVIQDELGWVYYGGKHYESIYTRFTQAYIQPRKFGIDKRKAHYSNLICMGEMVRDEALLALKEDAYHDTSMKDQDLQFFKKKMVISDEEFDALMKQPIKSYKDYKGYFNSGLHDWLYKLALKVHFNLKDKGFYGKQEA